ncbi:MAG TPA: isochorismate synthase, partial [Acidimicrobiales bacterium]|nr:isochorismate synthase [Acidimicrobiales bacterium]
RLWSRADASLLALGEALRLPLPASWAAPSRTSLVHEVLSAITAYDDPGLPGCGPVAIGALPYDPAAGGHLVIPRLVLARHGARSWATLIEEHGGTASDVRRAIEDELGELRHDPPLETLPDRFELAACIPHDEWKQLVAKAVGEMEGGSLAKVVLARQVEVVANRPFVLPETLARLASLYPSCTVFHVEGFIGASPEILLRRTGAEILSHPLAGTVARSGDPATDEALLAGLMGSRKDRHEHQLVVDAIAAKLRPLCLSLDVPKAPTVMPLRNVSHLGTEIRGVLSPRNEPLPTSLELAALLQPTPAVGGLPVDAALRWQRDNEGFDRRCYAGPVGWTDSRGDGEWALGLRSASVSGRRAVLYAGNGIVAGSDPDAELAETQLKLQALLAALVRP